MREIEGGKSVAIRKNFLVCFERVTPISNPRLWQLDSVQSGEEIERWRIVESIHFFSGAVSGADVTGRPNWTAFLSIAP